MLLKTGRMMDQFDEVDHFIVCVVSGLRKDGSAIMLNGVAGELSVKHPGMDKAVGSFIQATQGSCGNYLLRCETKIGIFQHGYVERDSPNLALVSAATKRLKEVAEANPDKKYALEAPNRSQPFWLVENILKELPDNVTVWTP